MVGPGSVKIRINPGAYAHLLATQLVPFKLYIITREFNFALVDSVCTVKHCCVERIQKLKPVARLIIGSPSTVPACGCTSSVHSEKLGFGCRITRSVIEADIHKLSYNTLVIRRSTEICGAIRLKS